MATRAIDFSDLGGKPVAASPAQSGIDFSDLGGKRVDAPPPAAGPHVDMQKQDAFGNPEGKPVGDQLGDMVTGAAKGVAQVSTPGMIASFMQRFAPETAAKLPNAVKENTTSLSHLPGQIVQTAAPMMAGDELPQASKTVEGAAKPTAPALAQPGMISRLAKVGWNHLPGVSVANDIIDAVKGPAPEPPPPPTLNFTPGPKDQWGAKIPTKEPDATASNKPYAGEKEPPPTKRGELAQAMAYRSRDVGEKGISYDRNSPAQATMSQDEATNRIAPARENMNGKAQETVPIALDQVPGFSVKPGPNGPAWVKFHGDVPESAISGEQPPAPARGSIASSMKPTVGDVADKVQDALGGRKLAPNVPLKEQLGAKAGTVPAAEPEHMGQFARANGLDLHQAIPETVQGDVLRAKIHNLSNVQVRQLAISSGEDMGQQAVSNAKNSGGVARQEVLKRIMAHHSPEQIGQLIDEGKHLPQRGNIAQAMTPK